MNEAEYTVFEKSAKATVRRISAENTWLRHSLMEMESRVDAMVKQLDALEARVKAIKKRLPAASPKTQTRTRSKR